MKKVSFDFDSTLDRPDVQEFCKQLVGLGYDVWIVTSRTNTEDALSRGWYWVERQNSDLYKVASICEIKRDNIKFTDHVDKIEFLRGKKFIFHLDDDEHELMEILRSDDDCKPINVNHFEWKETCLESLKNK